MENNPLNDRAAANIRAELARRKITQEAFADRLPMGRSSLSALLAGHTAITLPKLERIATALELKPSDLLA